MEVPWREVLVAGRHPRIAVAEDLHDGPLAHAGHRQGARGVVAKVVEGEGREPKPLCQPGEGSGQCERLIRW